MKSTAACFVLSFYGDLIIRVQWLLQTDFKAIVKEGRKEGNVFI